MSLEDLHVGEKRLQCKVQELIRDVDKQIHEFEAFTQNHLHSTVNSSHISAPAPSSKNADASCKEDTQTKKKKLNTTEISTSSSTQSGEHKFPTSSLLSMRLADKVLGSKSLVNAEERRDGGGSELFKFRPYHRQLLNAMTGSHHNNYCFKCGLRDHYHAGQCPLVSFLDNESKERGCCKFCHLYKCDGSRSKCSQSVTRVVLWIAVTPGYARDILAVIAKKVFHSKFNGEPFPKIETKEQMEQFLEKMRKPDQKYNKLIWKVIDKSPFFKSGFINDFYKTNDASDDTIDEESLKQHMAGLVQRYVGK